MRRAEYEARAGSAVVVECPPGAFIHCTADAKVLLTVANSFYRTNPADFVVLVVDTDRLAAKVKWEPPEPPPPPDSPMATLLFPHVFGDINREAVTAVRLTVRDVNGDFTSV
jgi:uncharacterized protein (DUF952 family)